MGLQLDAVAAQVVAQNPGLTAMSGQEQEDLLVALGPLACSLPLDVQRLLLARRGSLLHAARSLQGVRLHCNESCLGELARAAIQDAALGPLAGWTAEDVGDMGVIVAGAAIVDLSVVRQLVYFRKRRSCSVCLAL